MTLPALDEKHLGQLKKLLADTYDLQLESVHVEFDASGRMHVTGRKNGVVHQVMIKGEIE